MRKIIALCLGSALLSGCDVTPGMAINQGRDMVAKQLKDPESAQFGEVYFVERQKIGNRHYGDLCGSVNARNSFGGYAGMSRFVAGFEYSESGSFSMNGLTMESELSRAVGDNDASYFQDQLWLPRCTKPGTLISGK